MVATDATVSTFDGLTFVMGVSRLGGGHFNLACLVRSGHTNKHTTRKTINASMTDTHCFILHTDDIPNFGHCGRAQTPSGSQPFGL